MKSLEKFLAVLTVTARLSSCLESGDNITLIEADTSQAVTSVSPERAVDDCAEDEWSCHERGERKENTERESNSILLFIRIVL